VLQALLGLPAPAYHHHRLLLGADGRKLSKSDEAQSLQALAENGLTPSLLRAELGFSPPAASRTARSRS